METAATEITTTEATTKDTEVPTMDPAATEAPPIMEVATMKAAIKETTATTEATTVGITVATTGMLAMGTMVAIMEEGTSKALASCMALDGIFGNGLSGFVQWYVHPLSYG